MYIYANACASHLGLMQEGEAIPNHDGTEESSHPVHEGNGVLGAIERQGGARLPKDCHADEDDDRVHKVALALQGVV